MKLTMRIAVAAMVMSLAGGVRAETVEEWIALGARVHGAFGAFLPVGIRIGLDAIDRLKAERRDLTITYWNGDRAPCPCIVDGVMLAAGASPGQGTVIIAPGHAASGALASVVITQRRTGASLRYTIDDAWLPKILAWNKEVPSVRFDNAMKAEGLFTVESAMDVSK